MVSMAVFGGDAFSGAAMIRSIEKRTYIPSDLDEIIGFEPRPVDKNVVYIGQHTRTNGLIQTTLRGAPIEMRTRPEKNYRPIAIPRIAEGDQLFAHELADMISFEDETDEEMVATRIAEMQEDLIGDVEMTEENMRLGALQGIIYDSDGTTELVNYYTEFGITPPSSVDLTLDDANMTLGTLREKIGTLLGQPIARAARTGASNRIQIRAVCGDNFWYKLTGHPAVEDTYKGYAAAEALREDQTWSTFQFAGVTWYHYRGSDDGSTIAIGTNEAKVFPFGMRGMFQHVMGPFQESLNEAYRGRGRRYFPFLEMDKSEKQQWVQPEIYAYPLFVNARPDLVLTATV